ncbi:MAG: bifunctional diguanylate cyclase/phosphodiesterase [Actinomycetota bacterium]|nr:bifunctional diguanylate cyclase/phosphodiesterase [Actinomycetota bacterium]
MGGPEEARPRRLWQVTAWRVTVWLVLITGLTGSAVAGWQWNGYQQRAATKNFVDGASTVAATSDAVLERDVQFEEAVGQAIVTHPDMTNHRLSPWLGSLDLTKIYPGAMGFTFYARIPASGLADYRRAMASDPLPGLGHVPASVTPAGVRPYYCLPRFGMVLQAVGVSGGIDLCATTFPGIGQSPVGPLMDQAMTFDVPEYMNLGAIVEGSGVAKLHLPAKLLIAFRNQISAIVPIYSAGAHPATVAARRAELVGWMLGSFDGPALVQAMAPSSADREVTLETAAGDQLARGGRPFPGGMHLTRALASNPGLTVTVSGPATSTPEVQGTILGLIGAVANLLLFAFLLHLGRTRERALRLVEERTAELRHQALHDVLTDLPNRALLFDRAEQMLARARCQPMAIGALYLDLDNFKDVNDTFGHDVGDQLLQAVAERLRAAVREGDTVGRLGGDEFLILTESLDLDVGPECVAERVIALMDEPFELLTPEPITLNMNASVGVATGLRTHSQDLIRDADIALYQAKDSGKGRYVLFDPKMQAAVQDRLTLEMDLHGALDRGELYVMYQPIFDINRLQTKGVEALVRWQHPGRGLIGPAEFIPLAEQTGLIEPIGRFVLDRACADAAEWQRQGHGVEISVNVSVAQFEDDTFADLVRATLEGHGVRPESLTLEITETLLMRDTQATARMLAELKATGVRVAIDDFGTGHSSLAYLRQFPIDSLKIDRSFITRLGQSSQAIAIVNTLVQLGRTLGIETLAEGIEHPAQLAHLQEQLCDSGQGFLFARPLMAEDIPAFLTRGNDPVLASAPG